MNKMNKLSPSMGHSIEFTILLLIELFMTLKLFSTFLNYYLYKLKDIINMIVNSM